MVVVGRAVVDGVVVDPDMELVIRSVVLSATVDDTLTVVVPPLAVVGSTGVVASFVVVSSKNVTQ